VTEAIKSANSEWAILQAAAGTGASSAVYSSDFLKIVVQDASMTNQTHLFSVRFGSCTDERPAPGTDYFEPGRRRTVGLMIIIMTKMFLAQIFASLKSLTPDGQSGARSPHSKIQTNFVPLGRTPR
jgi:hypothetical protein